ncbi:hypothetical protein TSTA_042930 [Talaromyces stipitatus ATCC 10500]|uniref:Myb-like domain-containing protein n=1 Tax=Talaromyces stipitatus (strain ATCC 10500 / CBS 375.48 / QM 6759 / NRRL 1006) TaxID=441959 RepID=B8MK04_TALSN|nr:uncharacterized protein TSTA_042930 [Talaromyces stipitatus ATCC 10500]EED14821.1 hypothetical protein TSTA_042930 [Talaromyces stipitatus ATCC 10500]
MVHEKKALNRPPTRKLVRWNDDLDKLLLLTIQSVCNREGVKIPWAEVAKSMGNNVTEGAIIQHLAKLRVRRVEKNKQVPPPLRRGGGPSGASRSPDAPVTPVSPQYAEAVTERRVSQQNQPEIKKEKRSFSNVRDEVSDSDEDWTSDSPSKNKKAKKKRPQKKRKTTPMELEQSFEEINLEDDATEGVAGAFQRSDELVAVGANYLEFLGDSSKAQDDDHAAALSEDEDQLETKESLVITLKPGTNNMRRLKYKGTGVFQDRNPEQRWELPPPGPNGQSWGFSRDYYGPIPQSAQHSNNPGLLRGEWPIEVAMRQYEAPQAVTWSNETYHPDPRLVHPAMVLEDPNCKPQLKFHRKLRAAEEANAEARARDQAQPAYQVYVNKHRELPSYGESSWTALVTNPSQTLSNSFHTSLPQTEGRLDTRQFLDPQNSGTNDNLMDHYNEVPPGKIFAIEMLGDNIVEEAKELDWW